MTIKLILIEGKSENIKLIKDEPKQLKHLRVLARHHFGEKAIDSKFVVLFKDEQIKLDTDEYSLTKFYEKGKTLTIYVRPTDFLKMPENNDDDWDLVGTSHFSKNNNSNSPNKISTKSLIRDDSGDKKEDLSRLQEESIDFTVEGRMPSEYEIDQKFKENELHQMAQNIKEEYEIKIGELDIHFTNLLEQKEKLLASTLKEKDQVVKEKKMISFEAEKIKQDLDFMEDAYDTLKKYNNNYSDEKNNTLNELKKLDTFNPDESILENVKKLTKLQEKLNSDLAKITSDFEKKSQDENNQKELIETLKGEISIDRNEISEIKNQVNKYKDNENEITETINQVELKNHELNEEIKKLNQKYDTDISAAYTKAQELNEFSEKLENESKIAEEAKNQANKEISDLKHMSDLLEKQKGNQTDEISLLKNDIEVMKKEFSETSKERDGKQVNYEAEIKDLEHQNDVIEKNMLDLYKQIQEKEAKIGELTQELIQIKGWNSILEKKVEELANQLKNLDQVIEKSNQINEEHQKNVKVLEEKITFLKQKEEEFFLNISNQEKIISANNWEINQYKNIEKDYENLNSNLKTLKDEKGILESKIEQEKEKSLALEDVIKFRDIDMINKIDELTQQKQQLETKILDIEEKLNINEKETINLKNELDIKNQEINDHKEELKYVYDSNNQKISEKDQIIREFEDVKNKTQESFLQVEDTKKRADNFEENLNSANIKLQEYESEIKLIEEKLELKIKEANELTEENKKIKLAYEELRQAMTNFQTSNDEIKECNNEIKKKDTEIKLKAEEIKNKESEIMNLKNSIKEIEFNQSQISVIDEENMKALKEEIYLQEKQQFIENEAELTSMFKERENKIRKYFEDIRSQDSKKIKVAEKKIEMYKNMLKSLKSKEGQLVATQQNKDQDKSLNITTNELTKSFNDEKNPTSKISIQSSNLINEITISKIKLRVTQLEEKLSESSNVRDKETIIKFQQSLENYKKVLVLTDLNDANCNENINQIIENLLNEVQKYFDALIIQENNLSLKQQIEDEKKDDSLTFTTSEIAEMQAKNEAYEKEVLSLKKEAKEKHNDHVTLINKVDELNDTLLGVRNSLKEEKINNEELQKIIDQQNNSYKIINLEEILNKIKIEKNAHDFVIFSQLQDEYFCNEASQIPISIAIPKINETNSGSDNTNLNNLLNVNDLNNKTGASGFKFESAISQEKPEEEKDSLYEESSNIFTKTRNDDAFFLTNNNENDSNNKKELDRLRLEIDRLTAHNLELSGQLEDEKKKTSDIENTFQETQTAYENVQRASDQKLAENMQEWEQKMDKNQEEFNKQLKIREETINKLTSEKKNEPKPVKIVKDMFKSFTGNNCHFVPEKHDRIVCDSCYKCPIIGDRYKCLSRHGYDLCNDCYQIMNKTEPFLLFKTPSTISHDRLEDILPYVQILIREINEGKIKIIYND